MRRGIIWENCFLILKAFVPFWPTCHLLDADPPWNLRSARSPPPPPTHSSTRSCSSAGSSSPLLPWDHNLSIRIFQNPSVQPKHRSTCSIEKHLRGRSQRQRHWKSVQRRGCGLYGHHLYHCNVNVYWKIKQSKSEHKLVWVSCGSYGSSGCYMDDMGVIWITCTCCAKYVTARETNPNCLSRHL